MPPWGVTLSLSLVTQDQWDPGIGNWHFLLTCRDKKWEEGKKTLRDSYSNLIKSAALFLCRVPCCAFVPVCFFSRMLVMTKRRNKRSSSTSFLHLPSKEIISASEMTSRKTAWIFFFPPTSYQPATMSLRQLPGRQDGFRHFATHRTDNCAVLFRLVSPVTGIIWFNSLLALNQQTSRDGILERVGWQRLKVWILMELNHKASAEMI